MKRFKFTFLIVSFIATVLITGCKKEPTPNTEPDYEKANLVGTVQLFDEGDEMQTPEKMFVVIEGNSFITYSETEKDGIFTLRNVPFYNNYTLYYIKDGYTGSQGAVGSTPKLGMKSTTCVNSLVLEQDTISQDTAIYFKIGISSEASGTNPKYVRFFFHEINLVSDTTFTNYSSPVRITSDPASIVFTTTDFQGLGMQSGATYFVKAYGESYYTNEYFDFVKSREIFPNLCKTNSPEAVEIVIP
jgi:hypothetical protein